MDRAIVAFAPALREDYLRRWVVGAPIETRSTIAFATTRATIRYSHFSIRSRMLACRVLGHRWRFSAEDATMRWTCARGCGAGGEKRYESAERATRYARALDREDRDDLGRRPLLSLLPLGLARRARRDGGERGQ